MKQKIEVVYVCMINAIVVFSILSLDFGNEMETATKIQNFEDCNDLIPSLEGGLGR